jgi:hypothetical protein
MRFLHLGVEVQVGKRGGGRRRRVCVGRGLALSQHAAGGFAAPWRRGRGERGHLDRVVYFEIHDWQSGLQRRSDGRIRIDRWRKCKRWANARKKMFKARAASASARFRGFDTPSFFIAAAAGSEPSRPSPLDSPANQQDPKMTTNRMASLSAAIVLAMAALVLGQVPPSAFTFLLLSAP